MTEEKKKIFFNPEIIESPAKKIDELQDKIPLVELVGLVYECITCNKYLKDKFHESHPKLVKYIKDKKPNSIKKYHVDVKEKDDNNLCKTGFIAFDIKGILDYGDLIAHSFVQGSQGVGPAFPAIVELIYSQYLYWGDYKEYKEKCNSIIDSYKSFV